RTAPFGKSQVHLWTPSPPRPAGLSIFLITTGHKAPPFGGRYMKLTMKVFVERSVPAVCAKGKLQVLPSSLKRRFPSGTITALPCELARAPIGVPELSPTESWYEGI